MAVLFVPLVVFLANPQPTLESASTPSLGLFADNTTPRSWTRRQVLRDSRFYLLLPGLLAPALIITALFFHHLTLAAGKGWSPAWITGSYVIYAASTTIVALVCGPIIDRIGGTRMVPVMLVPIALGVLALALFENKWVVIPYFVLIGISIGIAHTSVAAMWAELYGVIHIGAIRSMVTALAVFASALGPLILGALIDAGVSEQHALLVFVIYAAIATVLMTVALRKPHYQSSPS